MELIELPQGNWVCAASVQAVKPTGPKSGYGDGYGVVLVLPSKETFIKLDAASKEDADMIAADIAGRINAGRP